MVEKQQLAKLAVEIVMLSSRTNPSLHSETVEYEMMSPTTMTSSLNVTLAIVRRGSGPTGIENRREEN
jgi:hypothetical protein